jgi:hypothetical protein
MVKMTENMSTERNVNPYLLIAQYEYLLVLLPEGLENVECRITAPSYSITVLTLREIMDVLQSGYCVAVRCKSRPTGIRIPPKSGFGSYRTSSARHTHMIIFLTSIFLGPSLEFHQSALFFCFPCPCTVDHRIHVHGT